VLESNAGNLLSFKKACDTLPMMTRPRLALIGCLFLQATAVNAQETPETLLLKDFDPVSMYRIPVSEVAKAKFPVIDLHSHPYAKTDAEIAQWVRNMDRAGIEKTIILSGMVATQFDDVYRKFAKYPDRFEIWCGLLFEGYDQPGYTEAAVKELVRCRRVGAKGVGELHDKGQGMAYGKKKFARRMHPDDERLRPVFAKCGELGMPVSIHVADPIWMYQKMDRHNDGLMNAWDWRLDNQPDIVDLPGMVKRLENLVQSQPGTTFIACHLVNLDYDLTNLGKVLDRHPNLYADISARYAETAATPRAAAAFYVKHGERLVYGTDMGTDLPMYAMTFRILETNDEHFYSRLFGYHWYLNGFGLPDAVLRAVYHDNGANVLAARKLRQ
jgi:predicted TIM-barrel fold metal-dependent hydrolase